MRKTYYTLIGIDPAGKSGNFEIIFGDFSRDVVAEEKEETNNLDYHALRIIRTSPDQKDIEAKVFELNTRN
jgi:hypothetical protein